MKNRKIFITKLFLPLLLIVSCLGTGHVLLAQASPITISTDIKDTIEDNLIVDLYKVSDIEWKGAVANYLFNPVSDFTTLFDNNKSLFTKEDDGYYFVTDTANPKNYDFVNEQLMQGDFADSVIDIVKGKPADSFKEYTFSKTSDGESYSASVNFDDVNDRGLYLLFVRGDTYSIPGAFEKKKIVDDTAEHYVSHADSAEYVYNFRPYLLFYDGRSNLEREFKIKVKYDTELRYGKLKIEKTVDDFINRNETFVFKVEANKTNDFTNPEYVKIVSINIKDNQLDDPVVLDNIRMYYYVRVTEVYDGASYKIDNENNRIKETRIVPEQDNNFASVSFRNVVDDLNKKGYGVNNIFKTTEKTDKTVGWEFVDNDLPKGE